LALNTLGVSQRGSQGYVPQVDQGERALDAHQYSAAASHFRYALLWDSKGTSAHVGLGEVYLKTGRKEKALQEFAAALAITPHSSAAERGIHDARTEGEEQVAFQDLEGAVQRDPHNPDLVTTYAEELIERGRLDEAKTEAGAALSMDPRQWHAYCALGRIAALKGNDDVARKDLGVAISHDDNDDDAIEALGNLEMKSGNVTGAVMLFRKLIKAVPDQSEGYTLLADALDKAGDATGAENARRKAKEIETRAQGAGN
jgi:Flp pilus assembly protein TadD